MFPYVFLDKILPELLVLLLTIMMIVFGAVRLFQGLKSLNWKTTTGKVLENTIEERGYPGGFFAPVLFYQYTVDGNTYQSAKYSFGFNVFSNSASVEEKLKQYPIGSEITVYYNPLNPKISVLNPGVKSFWGYMAIIFFCGALVCQQVFRLSQLYIENLHH